VKTPVIYSEKHALHDADTGTWVGVTIPSEEVPARIEVIVSIRSDGHEILATTAHQVPSAISTETRRSIMTG
jgi:hypothetical protein